MGVFTLFRTSFCEFVRSPEYATRQLMARRAGASAKTVSTSALAMYLSGCDRHLAKHRSFIVIRDKQGDKDNRPSNWVGHIAHQVCHVFLVKGLRVPFVHTKSHMELHKSVYDNWLPFPAIRMCLTAVASSVPQSNPMSYYCGSVLIK